MNKTRYKNKIRVVLADKMIIKTYLAEKLDVSNMTISRCCANTTQPSAIQLLEIPKILDCKLDDLFEPFK